MYMNQLFEIKRLVIYLQTYCMQKSDLQLGHDRINLLESQIKEYQLQMTEVQDSLAQGSRDHQEVLILRDKLLAL